MSFSNENCGLSFLAYPWTRWKIKKRHLVLSVKFAEIFKLVIIRWNVFGDNNPSRRKYYSGKAIKKMFEISN